MPSFRITMTIGALGPGIDPKSVLPAAVDATEELARVEASGLAIVRGAPRIIVRFDAEDAELAVQIGDHVAASVGSRAEVIDPTVTERAGGARWRVVRDS